MTDFVAICYNRCASCFCGHCDTRTRAKTHQTSNERTPLLSECDLLRTEGLSNRIVEESAGGDHSLHSYLARVNSTLESGSRRASQHLSEVIKDTER